MKKVILIFGFLFVIFLVGCAKPATMENIKQQPLEDLKEESLESSDINWKDITLKDVRTGKSFKISDFKGKPILLESFAVWCPTCRKQQDKIKELHEQAGDSVVSISIDTDPSEDESRVMEHVDRYGYNWFFAVDTEGFAKKLVSEFGINVVNAPSAPVVLICEDQNTRLLKFGVKNPDELKLEISKGC
jgi:thiol-disulfide isomerase/thioredoxin